MRLISIMLAVLFLMPVTAQASGGAVSLPAQDWSFSGPLGSYDRAALQRGYSVYRQVCSACHAMKRISFRNLEALGYNEDQIKTIAAEYSVMDGPDDEGEMFERSALPHDAFVSPYPNDKAAKAMNNGAMPPDLSLIAKARKGGADYISALLVGYEEPPENVTLLNGQYWNQYMAGHMIAMAPPLSDGLIAYEDGTPEIAQQYAGDVAHFLMWAADPYMEDRKRTGVKVLIFLTIFAGIMYAVKRRVWSDVH